MHLQIPELALVVLIGPSGSGKSTFARQHFKPTEVLSSDWCRALVADDELDQSATPDAFEVLHYIAAKRLAAGRLTVIDATSVQPEDRKSLVELARAHHVLPVAIVFDLPERDCHDQNAARTDRQVGGHVIHRQIVQMRKGLRGLPKEGFRQVYTFQSSAEATAATIERTRLWNDRRDETGPFDIIGDVHGCFDELVTLLQELGYHVDGTEVTAPPGRRALFVGDLVDRGPKTPDVLRLVKGMVAAGDALCVPGNHDIKLVRALRGKNVQVNHGLGESLAQLAAEEPEFRRVVADFLDGLISHYVLDGGKLVVAHAGLPEAMHGRTSAAVRDFCLFGETTGEVDEYDLPIRGDWGARYRGKAVVVYGHTPVSRPEWLNNTINIDTGCVFGGGLTALRYPERELVTVPALATYAESPRPLVQDGAGLSRQHEQDELLEIAEYTGRQAIETRLHRNVTIKAEQAAAALEVMGRFAVNPKWLVYLPPTMSPSETSKEEEFLEHPAEAFAYYRAQGIQQVVCQEKHMGSRTVVVLCKDEAAAQRRFGVTQEGQGIVYTRTGRRFFSNPALEAGFLTTLAEAVSAAGLWEELQTDWLLLDGELMPWSVKAQELLRAQYAAVGAAASSSLGLAVGLLSQMAARTQEATALLQRYQERQMLASAYVEAYGRYCWPVTSLADLRFAPFHLLASEGRVHVDQTHGWQMELLSRLAAGDRSGLLVATPNRVVDLNDEGSVAAATDWWLELTGKGGEGMVVKPMAYIAYGPKGLVQPAIKCRGREYLRIIYGPEYTLPENLNRLKSRGLSGKRSLALREFALGVEGLERFVRKEPLRRVHGCAFGVLALESEPIDSRL